MQERIEGKVPCDNITENPDTDTDTEREEHAIERRGRKMFILTDHLERSAQSDERERENGTRDRNHHRACVRAMRAACITKGYNFYTRCK